MLKLQTKNLEFIEHVWDLDIDPDQTTNRLVDATYRTTLGGNFKLQLENCLKDFWQLHAGGNYSKTWQGDTPRTCPWPRP
jgi:hypothetical protein